MSYLPAKFKCASVLVIGDVMLDRYWQGHASRISPEAPVAVVHVNNCSSYPGGAGNVALNISSLGARTGLIGLIQKDEAGCLLEETLQTAGIQTHFSYTHVPTITKLRVLSQHQQLIRLDFEQKLPGLQLLENETALQELMQSYQCLVLSDYDKGTLADPTRLIHLAREVGIPVLVDPKGADFTKYRHATLLSPNRKEFETVVGICTSEEEIQQRGLQLMRNLALEALLITRGAEGMTLLCQESTPLHLPAQTKEVFDVSGAGDTVIGVLGLGVAAGLPLAQAVEIANVAAGIVVSKLGTAAVTMNELLRGLVPLASLPRGVLSLSELLEHVQSVRQHGETIVMTNGCFDILHAGHVQYLQQARALGDRLIVAMNDDASISRLKGPSRPIVPLTQRMQVMSALGAVDWVVSFSADTPLELIEAITPDVLVKGGDYIADDIVGAQWVQQHGGEVVVVPFVDECSSSNIIKAIQEKEI